MSLSNFYKKKIIMSDVIDCAKLFNDDSSDKFSKFPYIYGVLNEDEDYFDLQTICYLDESPKVINREEVFTDFVIQNNLDVLCSGEVFMDVYDDLDERYPNFTKEQFIDALNYYMDNDDFIDL